jgi:hypothetical protein
MRKKILITSIIVLAIFSIAFAFIYNTVIIPKEKYDQATQLMKEEKYELAAEAFGEVLKYKDSVEQQTECWYQQALIYKKQDKMESANPIFEKIKYYKDSAQLIHYHEYKKTEYKKETCETDGFQLYQCACGSKKKDTIKKTGHKYYNATCTAPQKCMNCGRTSGESLGGHVYGKTRCMRCDEILVEPLSFKGVGNKKISIKNLPEGRYEIEFKMTKQVCSIGECATFIFSKWTEHGVESEIKCGDGMPGNWFLNFDGPILSETITVKTIGKNIGWTIKIWVEE